MGSDRNDDSSGKWRTNDVRSRSQLLLIALVAGLCLGVVFSERLYIRFQDQDNSPRLGAGSSSGAGGRRKLGQVITAPRGAAACCLQNARRVKPSMRQQGSMMPHQCCCHATAVLHHTIRGRRCTIQSVAAAHNQAAGIIVSLGGMLAAPFRV